MYISLQIHGERKVDGKSIVYMNSWSHLAWLPMPTQLCYSQIWWMSNAVLESFYAGDLQPSQATCSHAYHLKDSLSLWPCYCISRPSHLPIQNEYKEHIFFPLLPLATISFSFSTLPVGISSLATVPNHPLCSSGFPAHVHARDCLQVEVTCTLNSILVFFTSLSSVWSR